MRWIEEEDGNAPVIRTLRMREAFMAFRRLRRLNSIPVELAVTCDRTVARVTVLRDQVPVYSPIRRALSRLRDRAFCDAVVAKNNVRRLKASMTRAKMR
jgi:hypothetical protein